MKLKKIEKMLGSSSSRVMALVFPLSHYELQTVLKNSDCSQIMLFGTKNLVLEGPTMTRSCWKLSLWRMSAHRCRVVGLMQRHNNGDLQ